MRRKTSLKFLAVHVGDDRARVDILNLYLIGFLCDSDGVLHLGSYLAGLAFDPFAFLI